MSRGWARLLLLSSLLPLAASVGCDALTVNSFAGAVIEFTMTNAQPLPAGQHLEVWARNSNNDIIRIAPFYDEVNYKSSPGIMIMPAIDPDDPCLIDGSGNLLTTAAAYPGPTTINGVTQSPQQQAQQVLDRIAQLNASPKGKEFATLFAVLPWTQTPEPMLPATTTPDARLTACTQYWNQAPVGTAYVPNPYQITAPRHGIYYGSITFVTQTPPTDYDGVRLDVAVNLKGIQELFFTVEGNSVDPLHRGPLFLTSVSVPGGREVPHFSLIGNNNGVSGSASVYTNLDDAPAQF
jgi:hypothetical protein